MSYNPSVHYFSFSLGENIYLETSNSGNFLILLSPLKIVQVNNSLFSLLRTIQNEKEAFNSHQKFTGLEENDTLFYLIYLASKGFLKLDKVPCLDDYPRVSIIIPVRNQADDIIDCLHSISNVTYPCNKKEVIIIDDGSVHHIKDFISAFGVKYIRLDRSHGPAYCRNLGAREASGDILAFIDADCVASKNWLLELVPFLTLKSIGAVGGFVDSYYNMTNLDKYERVFSSLNLGNRILFEGKGKSNFYIPSCNILVKKEAFIKSGGFNDDLFVGEDVDLCWKIRSNDYYLIYLPIGKVFHKHRNKLFKMLRRKFEYGTSEAILYYHHRDKSKSFHILVTALLCIVVLILSILLNNPYILFVILLIYGYDILRKIRQINKFGLKIKVGKIYISILRSYLSFYYYIAFYLIRYYMMVILAFGFLFHVFWFVAGISIFLASVIDYLSKRPKILYPIFLFIYLLEHSAYQLGVLWGCIKLRSFRTYLPQFSYS